MADSYIRSVSCADGIAPARLVQYDATGRVVVARGEAALVGVYNERYLSAKPDSTVAIVINGLARVLAASDIATGQMLTSDEHGRAVAAAEDTLYCAGTALHTVQAGEIVELYFSPSVRSLAPAPDKVTEPVLSFSKSSLTAALRGDWALMVSGVFFDLSIGNEVIYLADKSKFINVVSIDGETRPPITAPWDVWAVHWHDGRLYAAGVKHVAYLEDESWHELSQLSGSAASAMTVWRGALYVGEWNRSNGPAMMSGAKSPTYPYPKVKCCQGLTVSGEQLHITTGDHHWIADDAGLTEVRMPYRDAEALCSLPGGLLIAAYNSGQMAVYDQSGWVAVDGVFPSETNNSIGLVYSDGVLYIATPNLGLRALDLREMS